MSRATQLLIVAAPDRPLTPEQQKFNKLIEKIDAARAELLAWDEATRQYAEGHVKRVLPLQREFSGCRLAVARRLDALLAAPGGPKTDRQSMREVLCQLAGSLAGSDQFDAAERAEMRTLHDQHADTDLDTLQREETAVLKELFEMTQGVDLGDEEFDNEDALLQRARERLDAQRAEQAEREAAQAHLPPGKPPRKKTAAQRKREGEEQAASQSVREVYRQLVSALHPDRAIDEADRTTRTAQMQRVNQAYDKQDLLALFALQLETLQVDAARLSQVGAERARHYNRVLAAQLEELQAEVGGRQARFCTTFDIDPYQRLQPAKLGTLLNREAATWRATVAEAKVDLRQLDQPASAKRWLKQMRRHLQAGADDGWA